MQCAIFSSIVKENAKSGFHTCIHWPAAEKWLREMPCISINVCSVSKFYLILYYKSTWLYFQFIPLTSDSVEFGCTFSGKQEWKYSLTIDMQVFVAFASCLTQYQKDCIFHAFPFPPLPTTFSWSSTLFSQEDAMAHRPSINTATLIWTDGI